MPGKPGNSAYNIDCWITPDPWILGQQGTMIVHGPGHRTPGA